MTSATLLIFCVIGTLPHVLALAVYDGILRQQYEIARSDWEQRGREVGYNWAPPGTSVVSRFIRIPGRQSAEWLRGTPQWARPFPEVTRRMWLFRILETVFLI